MSVGLIDYGMGNLASVARALERCGAEVQVIRGPAQVQAASRLVLPGVGSFSSAMANLHRQELVGAIREAAAVRGVPLLGICLGMQLLASRGTEGCEQGCEGLDLLPGEVKPLLPSVPTERVPHVGWNEVCQTGPLAVPLFGAMATGLDFYFVHSFHFQCANPEHIVARTPYCGSFHSVVGRGRIYGTQFHPEKSSKHGQTLIKNFLDIA